MAKQKTASVPEKRKPRLLWANPFCLLDTSSGASMTVRQMLLQLVANGYEVQVLGATVFDDPKGMGLLKEQFPDLNAYLHQLIEAEDGSLTHQLIVSYSHNRNHFTTHEEGLWYSQYLYLLDSFKPDIVWFYGGQTVDMLIADEARDRGIPVAFYLANGNYKSPRWCRDIDLIVTDSQATADMYRKEVGFASKPVGKFIASNRFIAEEHARRRLLFVNPSWQKGASVFVQLAEKLERERPEIELEVVEARADWSAVLRETTRQMGEQRSTLSNVTVTANTSDMRGPYSRARVLAAPSLWWESSGRVLAEAMLNGIPALITNRGGMPEMVGDAGMAFDFPEACYEAPYQHQLSEEELQPLVEAVVAFYDDEALYQEYVTRAFAVGEEKHHIDRATERLTNALAPLVRDKAGNKDFTLSQRKRHRQRLSSQATKPELKVDRSLEQLIKSKVGNNANSDTQTTHLHLSDDFTWQLKGKIIVLDNRASLIKSGLADQMAQTGAFGIVAFDPASEVKEPKQYEGSDTIQVFQHALLGDGNPATLHACVAAEMTSTLKPLPAEKLPERHRLGTQEIAELPINSVALDSITGLESLDWLILDELSDAMAVLEHGQQYLKQTLLLQVRIPFQLTHEKQPGLSELQHWASRHGFRFYRFHNISHYSHLPDKLNERSPCASEQESADVLFLPSHERMNALSDDQKRKLAFMLSACFAAHDMAFELMADVSQEKALELLEAQKILPAAAEKKIAVDSFFEVDNRNAKSLIDKEEDALKRQLMTRLPNLFKGNLRWFISKSLECYDSAFQDIPLDYAIAYSSFIPFLSHTDGGTSSSKVIFLGEYSEKWLEQWRGLLPSSKIECFSNYKDLIDFFEKNKQKSVKAMFLSSISSDFLSVIANYKEKMIEDFFYFIEGVIEKGCSFSDQFSHARKLSTDRMTIVCPNSDKFPSRLPKAEQLLHESEVMEKRLGYIPSIDRPNTFNEKIVYRKLFGAPSCAALLADKVRVREFVEDRVGKEILPVIYQVKDSSNDIDWKQLPKSFVMKSNHSNGQVKVIKDKRRIDFKKAEMLSRKWLESVYGEATNEYWYADIRPLIYFEEILKGVRSSAPEDYKFHVFNGRVEFILYIESRGEEKTREAFFSRNWDLLPFTSGNLPLETLPKKPAILDEMISIAERLASGFGYLRVDLYLTLNEIKFGEITLSPMAGWALFKNLGDKNINKSNYELDLEIGRLWQIEA